LKGQTQATLKVNFHSLFCNLGPLRHPNKQDPKVVNQRYSTQSRRLLKI